MAVHLLCAVGTVPFVLHKCCACLAVGEADRTQGKRQETPSKTGSKHGQSQTTQDRLTRHVAAASTSRVPLRCLDLCETTKTDAFIPVFISVCVLRIGMFVCLNLLQSERYFVK